MCSVWRALSADSAVLCSTAVRNAAFLAQRQRLEHGCGNLRLRTSTYVPFFACSLGAPLVLVCYYTASYFTRAL